MQLLDQIRDEVLGIIRKEYQEVVDPDLITISPTRVEFDGDMTIVIFPLVKKLRKNPQELGALLGGYLQKSFEEIESFNVVKGFLNLVFTPEFWFHFLGGVVEDPGYGSWPPTGETVMIEFSSPNTNKPLHLGHIRNILLGWSCSKILEKAGSEVVRVQVVNDRGIAICKSMLAWQIKGNGATPELENIKGDHFVGKYYVLFEKMFSEEYKEWQETPESLKIYEERAQKEKQKPAFFRDYKNIYFNNFSPLGRKAKEMLRRWEKGDPDTIKLWNRMNNWVYEGFSQTYEKLGVEFDHLYYESTTWKLGKQEIKEGLKKNHFFQKEDGSVWIDLTAHGMDEKILLRSDGTSVYMTQDIGTAIQRYKDYGIDKMVYVVADEQNYHFQVLFKILEILEEPYASGLYHLAYGMVDLPSGKMKSREGTVVDADDLMKDVIAEAAGVAKEKGDIEMLSSEEREEIYRKIGMAALKFFILKVNPSKRMTFDPAASVDMQGQTGPYIQNAYVRIRSIMRKASTEKITGDFFGYTEMHETEKILLQTLYQYPLVVKRAAQEYDPSEIAGYCYDLAKAYHRFYHDLPILSAKGEAAKGFRLAINQGVALVLRDGMNLLGIEMPDRM